MATPVNAAMVFLLGLLLCPTLPARAQELIQSGGFEAVDPWTGCGGVETTTDTAHTGQLSARVGGITDGSCGSVPTPQFVLVQQVTIPADATDLTLSFWVSRLGPDLPPDGNTVADMDVSLSTDPFFGTALFDVVSHNVLRGWTPFRGHLRPDDLASFRGQSAYLRFAVSYTGDYDVAYAVDDVSLVVGDVRTQAEPLPQALAGDGSRPLVLLQQSQDGLSVVRLDTDGTNAQAIDTGLYHEPRIPRWSPDGSTIAVVDDDVTPHDVAVPAMLKARISRLSVMRPDGTGKREIFATAGLEGTSGSPPFCRPPQCVDTPRAALDQVVKSVDWSPDGSKIALTVCARNRWHWGESGDDTCRVTLVDAASGEVIRDDLEGWFGPDWGSTGRMLLNGQASYPDYTTRGVWETDPSVTPPAQELILPASADLFAGGDRLPTWAPDGRRFVTAREIGGARWDANGFVITTEAVVLHDREDLGNPRVLLIADHGGVSGAIGDFTWSPDGRWVLYTLYEAADAANVWWLDAESGATGRLTDDGASVSVDWRQRAGTSAPEGGCSAAAAGVARAACYLEAITTAVPTGRRLLKRIARGATVARKRVLRLEKKSSERRVTAARKAILAVGGAIDKAKTKGALEASDAANLAAMATAAVAEIDAT